MKLTTKILIVACILGLSLLLYPSFSNYWNEKHAISAINTYLSTLQNMDVDQYRETWDDAVEYNAELAALKNQTDIPKELKERYNKTIYVSETGVMGYIEIPKLDVSLPVYHGTSEGVLQHAIGHINWTSLPTGGESTHCVLSGHRGLPSAKLFTDLDKLREGDQFIITILDRTMTYQVDQIRTVLPRDTAELYITEGMDYCTLLTCTPYGINTHRLLVRGHRIENASVEVNVVSEAVAIDPLVVAPVVAFPLLFTLFMMVMLKKPKKKKIIIEEADDDEE